MTEYEWLRIFSHNLREMLKEAGMTQAELAAETGLSFSAISYYMNGCRMPGIKAIINISDVLGCTIDDLIYFNDRIE